MNNQFPEVGRLRNTPFPSTRPFTLSGETIFRQPPIKLKKYKKPRRKGKQGKIIYDNPRARFYRNRQLYRGVARPQRAARESGEGLRRPDTATPTNITINLADALDRRVDRDLEMIEDIVEKEIKKRRGPAINRQPLRIGDRRPPSRRSRTASPPRVKKPPAPEKRMRGRGQEGGGLVETESETSSEKGSLEGPLLQGGTPIPTTPEPEGRARGGEGRYVYRRAEPDDPDEPQEGSSEGSAKDDPTQSYTKGGIGVETSDWSEQQQRAKEAEQRRVEQIRRDKEEYAKKDKESSAAYTASREPTPIGSEEDNFSSVSGNVHSIDGNEREVRRQDDSSEQRRGGIRGAAAAFIGGLSKKGRRREGGSQLVVAPQEFSSPFSAGSIVGGGGQLTPSDVPLRVLQNPLDAPSTEASSEISTERLEEVLTEARFLGED